MAYQLQTLGDIVNSVMEELAIQSTDTKMQSRIIRDINDVYLNEVVPAHRWFWLYGRVDIEIEPYFGTGLTATVTPESNVVTISTPPSVGLGSFVGRKFAVDGFSEIFEITAHVAGSATITLSSNFTGNLSTIANFKIWSDTAALPDDCRETLSVRHDHYRQPMEGVGYQEFVRRAMIAPRQTGRPTLYATYDYSSFNTASTAADDRSRYLKFHPAINLTATTLHVDYIQEVFPLVNLTDEPLIPLHDRVILRYGALARSWTKQRNPEAAQLSMQLFERKLTQMRGKIEDSTDKPQLTPSSNYMQYKRMRVGLGRSAPSASDSGSASLPTYLADVTIKGAILAGDMTVNSGITIDGRSVSADGTELDAHVAATSGVHGVSGHVVGTTDIQSLTNKSLATASNSITGAPGKISQFNATTGNLESSSSAVSDLTSATTTVSNNLSAHEALSSGVHGVVGTVVGTTDTQTLTNKTLTSPSITTPTGIVKADVGLGNVDNTSDATKNAAVATLTNKTITSPAISSPTISGSLASDAVTSATIATSNTVSSISIGTGSAANTITIGGPNTTVNIVGSVVNESITHMNVGTNLVNLNTNGAAGSGASCGMTVEEASVVTGYAETSGDRNSWVFKAPNTAGVASLTPGATNDTVTLNAATAVLSNKTLASAALQTPSTDVIAFVDQTSTPATPAGGHKIYTKASGAYILDSTGREKPIGSGGGGSKNYLSAYNSNTGNGDFEFGNTTGFSLGNTGALTNGIPTATPTFGSGSSTALSISAVTAGKLAGAYSLSYASTAATTVGDMLASDPFTIDIEDQAKVLAFKFAYSPTVGSAAANFSGTSSNSFAVAIYDVTNAAWINPSGAFGITQGAGVGICTGTFQTTSNSTQYRLVIYNANATTGAVTMLFDDVSVGPQTTAIGCPVTDWQAYSPVTAGLGTITSPNILWRRVGDSVEISAVFTTGTTTAVTTQFGLPAGLTIDSGKVPSIMVVGAGNSNAASTSDFGAKTVLATGGTTYLNFGFESSTGTSISAATASASFANNTLTSFFAKVAVQGWSSNVQMSSDTDTRVVSWSGSVGVGQALTAGSTDVTLTTINDRTGSWNGSQFRVPVAGDYLVGGALAVNQTGNQTASVYVNGTQFNGSTFSTTSVNSGASAGAILITGCKAGDLLSLRTNQSATVQAANLSIFRLSGPAVVAATATVAARYYVSASTAPGTNQINFDTKVIDTHGAVTTGASWRFTAPAPGIYQIGMNQLTTTSGAGSTHLFKNGVTNAFMVAFGALTGAGLAIVQLNTGDYIDVRPNNSAYTFDSSGGTDYNNIYVVRIQ